MDQTLEIPVNRLKPRVTINPDGQVVRNLSGELTLQVAKLLKPTKMETRKTLLTLRGT